MQVLARTVVFDGPSGVVQGLHSRQATLLDLGAQKSENGVG